MPCRYETGNHLWLILEYCVGGDLKSLLIHDIKLPETSVHDFGRDLLSALQYLHSRSTIHCDLKPSNILLDEDGTLKLGGFSVARKLSDINQTPVHNLQTVRPASGLSCWKPTQLVANAAARNHCLCRSLTCTHGSPPAGAYVRILLPAMKLT